MANDGHDTRRLQAYLGHKNIQHTVRYTELAPTRPRLHAPAKEPQQQLLRLFCWQMVAVCNIRNNKGVPSSAYSSL